MIGLERCIFEIKYIVKKTILTILQKLLYWYNTSSKYEFDLDEYIASEINKYTFRMSKNVRIPPKGMSKKKWEDILSQISFGFGSYIEMRSGAYTFVDKEYKRLDKEFKVGMKLFAKYFERLW